MKGYKGFNEDLTCHGFQYEVGNIYEIEGKPLICKRGFHFCEKLEDVFEYYDIAYDNENEKFSKRFCEVEALGDIITKYNKSCTNKIKIIRELSEKDICKILNVDYDTLVKYKKDFNDRRINQILYGLIEGLDVSVYTKPEFNGSQMVQIRWGLEDHIDVSTYAKPEFDGNQMREIRFGLEDDLDVSVYAKPEINWEQMREIRCDLMENLEDMAESENEE